MKIPPGICSTLGESRRAAENILDFAKGYVTTEEIKICCS